MLTYSLYKHALSTRNKQFWFLQLIGWSGYSFVVFISVVAPYSNNQKIVTQLQTLFMESATGVIFTLLLRTIFRWTWHKPVYTKVIVSLLSAFAASACWTITKHLSYRYLRDYDLLPITWIEFGGWFLFSLATMLAWTTFYYAILNYVELQAQNKKTLQAQNDAQLAQLKMLRYQLNPHFIFNAINAVSTLILKNENAKALSTLQKISEMLRYSLDCDPLNKISIKQEVDFLHKYLKIEKIRYANRLTIKTYIAPTAENYLVPNLIMQPLVENAIKHGISKAINGGLIIIRVDILETTLKLTVQDSGHGVADINSLNSSPGVGITNIVSRLQNLYNGHATLNFSAVSPQGLRAVILLPLENARQENNMHQLRAILVDDEPLALEGLKLRLDQFDCVKVVSMCGNGKKAITAIRKHTPDVVFLDLEMPGLNGFEVIHALGTGGCPPIVFTTAYDQYAVKAFEFHVVDYMLKPISIDRLRLTIDRLTALLSNKSRTQQLAIENNKLKNLLNTTQTHLPIKPHPQDTQPTKVKKLAVKNSDNTTTLVPIQHIQWIDAAGDYMCIHTAAETHVIRDTMKRLENILCEEHFLRIHKSTIVNTHSVTQLKKGQNSELLLQINNNTELRVSRRYKHKVHSYFIHKNQTL